ncbi:hypothetical protein FBU30_011163 [Linnemannia zychae]|nr:hypothetical protein FBU30_011163 [Linnemannia zychae]
MESLWAFEQGSARRVRRSELEAVAPEAAIGKVGSVAASSPDLLTQDTRFLLSPVPASMAQGQNQEHSQSKPVTTSSSSTVTLYPLENVPSHLLCAICTLPYENPVHFLPCCHVFCLECIQLWIVMNLGDELLQNELRRAYPAEDERQWYHEESGVRSGFDEQGQYPHLQQQFMVELARMGQSTSRSGTGAPGNSYYDNFSHFSPAQQQLLQQQQIQQRIAILLESREMPKCPMCRTSLHIQGWDRIEERVKIPTVNRPRPISQTDGSTTTTLSFSDWIRGSQNSVNQGERPVSGVERRRRHDRFTGNRPTGGGNRSGGREDAIGEEDDEEIEMEHVRTSRNRNNLITNGGSSISPSPSITSGPSIVTRHQYQEMIQLYNTFDMNNDDEEIQSPTTAVIGRRPSELMRYQQRQQQAYQERQQANRQRAAAAAIAADVDEPSNVPHLHTTTAVRLNEQQEQIRRLYLEQESQEELLRALSARAASIIEEEEENMRLVAMANESIGSTFNNSNQGENVPRHGTEQQQQQQQHQESQQLEHLSSVPDHPISGESTGSETYGAENTSRRVTLIRQSTLQIDTTITRPGSRQSQASQNHSTHSRQISYDPVSRTDQVANLLTDQSHGNEQRLHSSFIRNQSLEQTVDSGHLAENSIINDIWTSNVQQETLIRAEQPSNLLDLENQNEPTMLSMGEDDDGDMSVSDSVSNSTISSNETSDIQFSPSNESTLSYGTASTYSHGISSQTATGTPFSQRSSSHPHWERHSLSLQMPTIETEESNTVVNHRNILRSLAEGEEVNFDNQSLSNYHHASVVEEEQQESSTSSIKDQGNASYGEFSGSTLDMEISRAESKSRAEVSDRDFVEEEARSSSSTLDVSDYGPTGESSRISAPPEPVQDQDSAINPSESSSSFGLQPYQSSWTSRSPSVSPLVQDLDIHYPIVTAEGSITTIANMQIDADILARARSDSVLLSDDDLSSVHNHPSPVDSPIPTPSTARPRQRFPIGFSLLGDDGEPAEDEEEEVLVHEPERTLEEEMGTAHHESELITEDPTIPIRAEPNNPLAESEVFEAITGSNSTSQAGITDESHRLNGIESDSAAIESNASLSSSPAAIPVNIQDPLSVATVDSLNSTSPLTDAPSEIGENILSGDHNQSITTPFIGPLRDSLSSPPPLPLPLAAVSQDHGITDLAQPQESSPRNVTTFRRDALNEASSLHIQSLVMPDIPSISSHSPPSSMPRGLDSQLHIEEEPEQFRIVVRYQPRLPKAHIMSDLISQIRVECPNKQYGCTDTMEVQQTLQHGRDQCKFRMIGIARGKTKFSGHSSQISGHANDQNNIVNSKDSSLATPTSTPNPLIPSCPGLTWEREQLTRATGIIGHLQVENSNLRQMIRQLTLQNTKLTKEKDRLQRYANLGLGRSHRE